MYHVQCEQVKIFKVFDINKRHEWLQVVGPPQRYTVIRSLTDQIKCEDIIANSHIQC